MKNTIWRSSLLLMLALNLIIMNFSLTTPMVAAESSNTTLFQDDFANESLVDWENNKGVWSFITDNGSKVLRQSANNASELVAGMTSWTDYDLEADVRLISGAGAMLNFRYQDNLHYYYLYMNQTSIHLYKQNGAGNQEWIDAYDDGPTLSSSEFATIKVSLVGNQIKVYRNGDLILDFTDQVNPFMQGKFALASWDSQVDYRHIKVTSEVEPFTPIGDTVYYISSSGGDDANDGLSEATAWKTLSKISGLTFQPGNKLLLKSGDSWNERLILNGSGSVNSPIVVSSYGTGSKPIISATAPKSGVIAGSNLNNWVISGLAIQIIASSSLSWDNVTHGIFVDYDTSALHENLLIDNNEIYSSSPDSNTFGILISAIASGSASKKVARNITISNNTVHDVGWYGITTTGWDTEKGESLWSQVSFDKIKVSGNRVSNTGSQGIVIQNAHNSVIERNVVHHGGQVQNSWGPGGIWFIASRDSVMKFNEVYDMSDSGSNHDGAGINIDWYCNNITVQYNYLHDNKGNGITTMSNYGSKILNNKLSGNKGLQVNGRGQIALGNFTGKPELTTGLHDLEVAYNTIIVDVADTVAVNTASNPHGTWTGNSIHSNNIVMKNNVANTDVFSIDTNTNIEMINNNNVFSHLSAFSAIQYGIKYNDFLSWQNATGFDGGTQLLPLQSVPPSAVADITAIINGQHYVELSWTASTSLQDQVAHYNVYRSTDASFVPAYSNMVGESDTNSFLDNEEMQPETTYYYKVEAEDRQGNTGAISTPVSITTGVNIPVIAQPQSVDFLNLWDQYETNVKELTITPYILDMENIQKLELYVDNKLYQQSEAAPYDFKLTGLNSGQHRLMLKAYTKSGDVVESRQIHIHKKVSVLRSLYSTDKPDVDGILNDWDLSGFILDRKEQVRDIESGFAGKWNSQKLQVKGAVTWDNDNLYVAAEVTEDQHHLPITEGADLWKGSSLQIAIDPERGSAPGKKGYTELAFGLTNNGQVLAYRYNAISGKITGQFTSGQIAVERDDTNKKTSYEIAIPWEEILPVDIQAVEGADLGISLLANYSDGTFVRPNVSNDARNGWIEYNGGIGSEKAPSKFGYLLLEKNVFAAPQLTGSKGENSVSLSWQPNQNAAGYIIKYGTAIGVYDQMIDAGDASEIDITGLVPGRNYHFILVAYDAYGESLPSGVLKLHLNTNTDSTVYPPSEEQKGDDNESELEVNVIENSSLLLNSVTEGKAKVKVFAPIYDVIIPMIANNGTGKATLALPYPSEDVDVQYLGIYRFNDDLNRWDYVGGEVNSLTGQISTSIQHSGTYAVLEYARIYNDVPLGHWAMKAIQSISAKHLVADKVSEDFHPAAAITRAEFIDLLMRALQVETAAATVPFNDVKQDAWYARSIAGAVEARIIKGRSADRFEPDQPISRIEAAVIIARSLKLSSSNIHLGMFNDSNNIPEWAQSSVSAVAGEKLMMGRGNGHFYPQQYATRAEAAQLISNIWDYLKKSKM